MIDETIDFFANISKDSWRDVVISSFLIPFVFYLFTKLRTYFILRQPLNLVLNGFRKSKKDILIFLAQLSVASNQLQLIHNQKYVTRFPQPLPQNQTNLGILTYQNIDPVWSQSDGLCAAEVFNLLGQINKHQGFRIADTIRDWNEHSSPIFSVGFNPKTHYLMNFCNPINFQLLADNNILSISGHNLDLGAFYPADAGIVQKTFLKNSKIPVFILAGLGTTGTEAAGKILNDNCVQLGKLYGSDSFCILFKTNKTRGSKHYDIVGIFPKPKLYRALFYPITFIMWYLKKVFPLNVQSSKFY